MTDPEQSVTDRDTWECRLIACLVFTALVIWVCVARAYNKIRR